MTIALNQPHKTQSKKTASGFNQRCAIEKAFSASSANSPNFFFNKTKLSNCYDTLSEKNSVIDKILAPLQLFKFEPPLAHDRVFVGAGTNWNRR